MNKLKQKLRTTDVRLTALVHRQLVYKPKSRTILAQQEQKGAFRWAPLLQGISQSLSLF
jgi:hypothetical protein